MSARVSASIRRAIRRFALSPWRLVAFSPFLIAAALAPPVAAQQSGRYTVPGDEVAIYNIAGEVTIGRASGGDVEVVVRAGGDDAEALRVATGEVGGRGTLRVIYPSDEVSYRSARWSGRTTIRVHEDGTFGSGGRRVQVRGRSGGGLDAHADLEIRIPAGKRVAVLLGVGTVEASDLDTDLLIDVAAASVDVNGLRGALLIDTGSGSVDVRDVEGEVGVDTGSGSITISGIRGPRLKVDTGSGSVRGDAVSAGDLTIDTGSGRIDLSEVSARRVKLDTGSGSVRLGLLSDIDELRIDTGSGSVNVRVPDDLGAELEIETGSGGINMDVPVQTQSVRRNEFRGRIGDGNGRIVIDTGSGGVRISR